LDGARSEGRSSLYEHEVYGILSCLGLTVPLFHFVRDPREVNEAGLRKIGPTLVVKIVSPDVPHKQ
jgi:acyl-CoA synthetase (NDP forming)